MRKSLTLPRLLILLVIIVLLTAGCSILEGDSLDVPTFTDQPESLAAEQTTPEEDDENILLLIEIDIILLFIASLVGILAKRLRVPYTVGLVLIGLVLSFFADIEFDISPNLFLGLLVPPLIFEAAFHLKIKDLRRDLTPILALAIPGVLLTTLMVAGILSWGTNFSLEAALIFGALIAATDPVAAISLFRSLGVPKRLQVLIEGESLFNDGIAIVLFNLMITIALTGQFNLANSILDFILVSGGGLLVGFILGLLISQAISIINDSLIETTLTSVLAFGSYILAEQFHVSGVLAVVAAGLVSGNLGPSRMAPSTRVLVFNFWEYAAFLANSFVFLLIGMQIDLNLLLANWYSILWAIVGILASRAVGVYGLSWLGSGVPKRYKPVMYWGGLKGAISLALALSLPVALGQARDEILALTFGSVLFTLLFQGLTMKPLINRLDLLPRSKAQRSYELKQARSVMARSAHHHLQELYQEGYVTRHVWKVLSEPLQSRSEALSQSVTQAMHKNPEVEAEEMENAIQEILEIQRSALQELLREGKISEKNFSNLVNEVDTALTENRTDLVDLLRHKTAETIDSLMTIIVPEHEVEEVTDLLVAEGFPVTHVASRGGFAGRKNATLLVGIPAGRDQDILSMLRSAGKERVREVDMDEHSEVRIEGGATVFSFDVERYEVI